MKHLYLSTNGQLYNTEYEAELADLDHSISKIRTEIKHHMSRHTDANGKYVEYKMTILPKLQKELDLANETIRMFYSKKNELFEMGMSRRRFNEQITIAKYKRYLTLEKLKQTIKYAHERREKSFVSKEEHDYLSKLHSKLRDLEQKRIGMKDVKTTEER